MDHGNVLLEQLVRDPGLPVDNPTRSYWQEPPHPLAQHQSANLPSTSDVIVIGSGITGCSVAKHILEHNDSLRVTILEARNVCSGATGRNGGHIKAVPEGSYSEILPELGKSKAQEVVKFVLANVQELFRVAKSLPSALEAHSEVRQVESISLFTDQEGFQCAKEMVKLFDDDNPDLRGRARIVEKAELVEKHNIENAVGGMASSAGAAWPYRLITSIYEVLFNTYGTRFTIESNTPVQSIAFDNSNKEYAVKTSRGLISGRCVVHATNGHAGHLLPGIRGSLFPVRGQMTSQAPSKTFGIQGERSWSIHYSKGFDYITQSAATGEIFIGGALTASDPLSELGMNRDDAECIESIAHLGGIMDATWGRQVRENIKSTWTGVMGFTTDGLPLVGKCPQAATLREGSNEFAAVGYNGYGMPNAWLCGQYIAGLVLGKENFGGIPSAYAITEDRLKSMNAEKAAQIWMGRFAKP